MTAGSIFFFLAMISTILRSNAGSLGSRCDASGSGGAIGRSSYVSASADPGKSKRRDILTRMDLLDKLRAVSRRMEPHASGPFRPFLTTIDAVLNPGEVLIHGKRTLMFGSNNYFGLTGHPAVIAA